MNKSVKRSFWDRETLCQWRFEQLGDCWHLWTPEDYRIIFRDAEDFKAGMTLISVCAMLLPGVKILTFELMSNHIHVTAACKEEDLKRMFALFKKMLSKHIQARYGTLELGDWDCKTRHIENLEDLRTVIAYDNRNGYLVHPDETPFSYPWGANRYYFNPEAKLRFRERAEPLSFKERRLITHSHLADSLNGLLQVDGYVSPLCFCAIDEAEACFRDARHYFYKIARDIESQKAVSREIGENIFYTDDELFSALVAHCKERYDIGNPSLLGHEAKIDVAKLMRREYNAGTKQIQRMLKLDAAVITALFGA